MLTAYETKEEFIKDINKLRRASKNKWYAWTGEVDGVPIKIKAFGTWVQVLLIPPWKDSGPMDCSVKVFTEYLTKRLP